MKVSAIDLIIDVINEEDEGSAIGLIIDVIISGPMTNEIKILYKKN